MAERHLPAYIEPRLLEAIALLEPQYDHDLLDKGSAEESIAAWARVIDGGTASGDSEDGEDSENSAQHAEQEQFNAAFRFIIAAGAAKEDGGPGWQQLADMEESYANVLQELMVEHSSDLEKLQQLQHDEMTAQLAAGIEAQHLTTAARRRHAAATEALVHTRASASRAACPASG